MSELDARYARGQDTRRMFGGGTITSAGSVPGAWDVAPDLECILGEALFGTIWHRDALATTRPAPRPRWNGCLTASPANTNQWC
jgi:hypothetical protein